MSKHAYLIMAHSQFTQLKKLILLLDDPRNDIYIHVDSKSTSFDENQFAKMTKQARYTFIDRKKVTWGSFSQINCELRLLEVATKEYHDYYHLLSGSDLPIKSQDVIHSFFEENRGWEFLDFHKGAMDKKSYRDRIQLFHFLQEFIGKKENNPSLFYIEQGLLKLQEIFHINRIKKTGFEYKKGTNWFSITHDLALFVLSQTHQIQKTYRYTLCADEIFLHTLAWNSVFKNRIIGESKRILKKERPYTFRLEDYDNLMSSPHFWARKFNEDIDPNIVLKIFEQFVGK